MAGVHPFGRHGEWQESSSCLFASPDSECGRRRRRFRLLAMALIVPLPDLPNVSIAKVPIGGSLIVFIIIIIIIM
jgi:hypothetical protein